MKNRWLNKFVGIAVPILLTILWLGALSHIHQAPKEGVSQIEAECPICLVAHFSHQGATIEATSTETELTFYSQETILPIWGRPSNVWQTLWDTPRGPPVS